MLIPAVGPRNAKIALIGEAPGKDEWAFGEPFVGKSGQVLMALLRKWGIDRSEVYLTNVIKDSTQIDPLNNFPAQKIRDYISSFTLEIMQTSCNVYVPLGNTALLGMTGNRDISLWRGSILASLINGKKTIPTFHPAAALRDTSLYDLILTDFKRIIEESETPLVSLPQPELITDPTCEHALAFLRRIKDERKPFAFDVETAGGIVDCISFANNIKSAISIHLFDHYWNRDSFTAIYLAIKTLLENPTIEKGGHNVAYDILALRQHGINVAPPYFDTMHKHHCVDPIASKHSLAFLCSILTRQPFYKQWDHENELTGRKRNEEIHDRATYNAMDSVRTIESSQKLDDILSKRQAFYTRHYKNLLPHLIEMYDLGLAVDNDERRRLANKTKQEAFQMEKAIADKMGLKKFNSNSSEQTKEVVYGILKCKPKMKRRGKGRDAKKTLSTDEDTLLLLYQEEPIEILTDIVDARGKRKLLSFLEPTTKSALAKRRGNVIRTEYKPMTKTGRLSSSAATATKIGLNLQNQPKEVRKIFVPRPGFIFLARDLPQAEAQVTAADAENTELLHYFEMSKSERGLPKKDKRFDIHRKNAAISLSKDQLEITHLEREACKRVVHGTNYGMGAKKQQNVLLKQLRNEHDKPLWIPIHEVERRRNNYLASDPSIMERQSRIREDLFKHRKMINPFGRVIIFHEIINDPDVLYLFGQRDYNEVFQSAYSWFPQSTIADAINTAIDPLNRALREEGLGRVAAQIHDELLMEIRDDLPSIRRAVQLSGDIMSRPILIRGYSLQIFPDIKLGFDWGSLQTVELDEQVEELYRRLK